MRLVGRSEQASGVDLSLSSGVITIGSAPGNTLSIGEAGLAPYHVRLRRKAQEWLLEPVASRGDTYLNGIRVLGRHALRGGDLIRLGSAVLEVVAEPAEGKERSREWEVNRKAWLGASAGLFLLLAAVVALLLASPGIVAPLVSAETVTVMPTATPLLSLETPTPTPTGTATPAPTSSPTPVPAAPTVAASATPHPTATPEFLRGTLEAALGMVPHERAGAAMTAVARMEPEIQRTAVAALASDPSRAAQWVDDLLGTPTPVPPRGRLAFGSYSAEMDRYDLVLRDLETGTEMVLLTEASQPAFNPAGDLLAFRSLQADAQGLYAATATGAQRWLLTRDAHPEDGNPSWSPDGSTVAFASLQYGDGKSRIYVVPAYGGVARDICFGEHVDWAPDGLRIAVKGCIGGACGIILANPDGSGQELITTDASDGAPAWSPDGRMIAFHSARDGNWDIYVMQAEGSNVRRLTDHATTQTMPEWSPDGRYVAFRSNRGGYWAIWAVGVEGGQEYRLADAGLRAGDEGSERIAWLP